MIDLRCLENDGEPDNLESNISYQEDELYEDINEEQEEGQGEENSETFSVERRRKILILHFYLNEFPHKLGVYKDMDFESLSNKELDKIREEFDFIIGTKNTVNVTIRAFQHSIKMLEDFCVAYTPLKVQGLSVINNDAELMDDVKHFALQNMLLLKTKPEHRILFTVVSTMGVLHNINSQNPQAIQGNNQSIENNVNLNEFDDL